LPAPWSEAQPYEEVMLEQKLAGDHWDAIAVERGLLRRQARQVQRVEERAPIWPGDVPLWLTAPYVPPWLTKIRKLVCVGQGCYHVEPLGYCFLWVAANELP